jgi:tripartite-type tricarboxylate transporter receptor subunit TctC
MMKPLTSTRRSFVAAATGTVIGGAMVALAAPSAVAQELKGPVKIIVGYPPGGTADVVARFYADDLRTRLGVSVVVENKVGAGGQIAAETFMHGTPPDGSTLLLANSHMMATLPLTTRSIKYDPVKDFEPIAKLANFDVGVIAGSGITAKTLAEYVAAVRADAKLGLYGIPAPGSSAQFIGFSIGRKEQLALTAVPYKGSAPLISDLLGGQVPISIDIIGSVLEHVKQGRLRVLAVARPTRLRWLPDVPTLAEAGYKDLDRSSWMGLFAPVGTPPAVIQRLHEAVAAAAAQPKLTEQLDKFAIVPASSTPQELRELIRQELATWGPIVKASSYQVE